MRVLLILLSLTLALATAGPLDADEGAKAKAARKRLPRCLRYARMVATMVERNDLARLRTNQRGIDPDPWLISWILIGQGKASAAETYLRECACPELEGLPTHLKRWASSPPPKALIDQVVSMESGLDINRLDFEATVRAGAPLIAGEAPFPRALALVRSGDALRRLRKFKEAAALLAQAEKACTDLGWTWGHDQAVWQRGKLQSDALQAREALATLEEVVRRRESLRWKTSLAYAYADLAAVHGAIGDYRAVLALNTKALLLIKPSWRFHVRALFYMHTNRALALLNLGDLSGALHEYEEAASLGDAGEHPGFQSYARIHIAWIQARLGRLEAAERTRREAEAFAAKCPDEANGDCHEAVTRVEAFTGGILGLRARKTNSDDDWVAAINAHKHVHKTFVKRGEKDMAAKALLAQATALAWRGHHAASLGLLESTRQEFDGLHDEQASIQVQLLEGWLLLAQGDTGRAGDAFDAALKRAGALELRHAQAVALHGRAAARSRATPEKKGDARHAHLNATLADVEQALRIQARLASGLAEEQVASAREGFALAPLGQDDDARGDLFNLGLSAALAMGDAARLFGVIESSRALGFLEAHAGMEQLRAASAAELEGETERAARREEALARFELENYVRRRQHTKQVKAAEKLREAMARTEDIIDRAQRRAKARGSAVYPRIVGVTDVQAALASDDVLVSYAVVRDRVHAVMIAKTGPPALREIGPIDPIRAAIQTLRAGIGDGTKASADAFSKLGTLLVAPLRIGSGVKRVLLGPDGALHAVPFAALLPEREVTQIPSASAWLAVRGERGAPGKAILAVGAPTYAKHRGVQELPGARAELEAVPGEHVRRLMAEKATMAELLAALPKESARLRALHVACHGVGDEEHPSSSALELAADKSHHGTWRARDIMLTHIPAEVVILSACRTGIGRSYRGEGLLGLPRAFLIAGADRVIASLWVADDEATQALMGHFYAAWKPGTSAASALRQAQAKVRADPRWSHPYYWAAWVLWGREG